MRSEADRRALEEICTDLKGLSGMVQGIIETYKRNNGDDKGSTMLKSRISDAAAKLDATKEKVANYFGQRPPYNPNQ